MGFSLKMLLPPFLAFVAVGLYGDSRHHVKNWEVLGLLTMGWGFIAFVIVMGYWIVRAARRATRDTQHYR